MGYQVNLFVDEIDENLVCSVCSGVLQNAVLTSCGHSFCSICINTWINRASLRECGSRTEPGSDIAGIQVSRRSNGSSFTTLQIPGSGSSLRSPSQSTGSFSNSGSSSQILESSDNSGSSQILGSDAFFWETFGPEPEFTLYVQQQQQLRQRQQQQQQQQRQRQQHPDENEDNSGTSSTHSSSSSTCPQCRTRISPSQIHPIRSLRSLILSLLIRCQYVDDGCSETVPLERQADHEASCEFGTIECAGCEVKVPKDKLPDHQLSCPFILALYHANRPGESHHQLHQSSSTLPRQNNDLITSPAYRINYLSQQIKLLQSDLKETRLRNELLTNQLQQAKNELEHKQRHILQIQNIHFDSNYDYGFTNSSVCKLSGLISRFLTEKPEYVDAAKVFPCIKRCYDNFGRCGNAYEDDVYMLLATASASSWFTEQQQQLLRVWTMSLARYKECTSRVNIKRRS